MKVEIDQSGRVEYTSHKTVIADSLGNTICISKSHKRELQIFYRKLGYPREFTISIFSVLISLLISKSFSSNNYYYIDEEYVGQNTKIANLLLLFLQRLDIKIKKEQIIFKRIGKKSKAHEFAYKNFTTSKNIRTISIEEILAVAKPKKRPGC